MDINSYQYNPSYYNISRKTRQPIAVAVTAYNRPKYFKHVIGSLEKNAESQVLPFYFFLDGGEKSTQDENTRIIQNSKIKNKHIIVRERNYGCAKNLIDARRFMFDWCNYKKVIMMEDDLIVTPHYIRTTLALHQWAREHYSNVGVVQCWSYCFLTSEEKRTQLHFVKNSDHYWWSFVSYCLDQEVWIAIRSILYEYEEKFVDKIPWTHDFYKERSKPGLSTYAPLIRMWVQELIDTRNLNNHTNLPLKKGFSRAWRDLSTWFKQLTHKRNQTIFNTQFDLPAVIAISNYEITNQDLMTGFALWMAGYIKIQTTVNRAKHIGKNGVTINEDLFNLLQHDKIRLDNYEEDSTITLFEEVSE